jgi:GNAT superfamily N-acetyltransferase
MGSAGDWDHPKPRADRGDPDQRVEDDGLERLRLAVDSDAEAIATLWLRSRRTAIPSIPAPVHSDEEVHWWVAERLIPNGGTWVLEGAPGFVGMMTVRESWIEQLYVDPAHSGRGAGARLLGKAKKLFPGGLDLWTFESNIRAQHFYEVHGFVLVDQTSGNNEEGAPDLRYHWDG